MGVSESMGALGADFTAIGINPAGIGLFRKSDFYVSVYANIDEQEATLNGPSNSPYSKTKDYYGLGGIGIVFTATPWDSKWKNASFAINFIKTADFRNEYYFKGRSVGSITDRFLELSLDPNKTGLIGLHPDLLDDFEAGLAYETGAVFDPGTDPQNFTYTTDLLGYPGYLLPKEQILKTSGGMYNFSFGIGGNYDEKFAVGATIDIPFGDFSSESRYREYEAQTDEVLPFKNLEFREDLTTEVAGVALKLGAIFKPTQNWRLGIAWQTPTYLWMTDRFNTSLSNTYYNGRVDTSITAYSPDGEFTYRLIVPMRAVLSGAYVAPKGFVSADIDVIPMKMAKYNLTADSDESADFEYQEIVNNDIDKQYRTTIQYRLGGELAFDYLRVRGGVELLQQAYSNSDKYDKGFSLGLGYRGNSFYVDLGYKYRTSEQAYEPYLTGNSDFNGDGKVDAPTPIVNQKSNQQLIQLTLGFKL
jgi:hypothetical protein